MSDQMRRFLRSVAPSLQVLAGVVLLLSFRYPAVTILPDGSWGPHGPISGFQCAFFAPVVLLGFLFGVIGDLLDHSGKAHQFEQAVGALLIGFSGLINFLVPWYLFAGRGSKAKVAFALCICLVMTIPGILLSNMVPLTACYVWMGAALLMISLQLFARSEDSKRQI